jgi:formamidopyrimidine-DNA glycosylase
MPELPDLLHVVGRLNETLKGLAVGAARVREPVVLRYTVPGDLSLLVGRILENVDRKAHFVVLRFEGLDLAVNPMLAGRFRLAPPGAKDEAALAFGLGFKKSGEQVELRYLDDKKMGNAYLMTPGDWKSIPGVQAGGIDVLSAEFTWERFTSLLQKRRDQVRVFLLDKKALDSIGNAYADEILFEAGIHPKTWCRSLSREDAIRLHHAIRGVIRAAADEVARRDEPIEVKVRDFLKVRLKSVCPKCTTKLRTAGVRGMDAYFCPKCQPATRPGFVDWTRTGL